MKRRLIDVLIGIVICFIAMTAINAVAKNKTNKDYEEFNRFNLCYDADSWFVVIDKETGMYELAYGSTTLANGYVSWLPQSEEDVIYIPTLIK